MRYFCNPLNIFYRYQLLESGEGYCAMRESADPSLVLFKGRYYLFPSMTAGFFESTDLVGWNFHEFRQEMPVYDYAPDVTVIGKYLYFCASKNFQNCPFYRTADPIQGVFEKIEGTFPFWDPNLFWDDDGKLYFYWGCSNNAPIYGVELDPETMRPMGEKQALFRGDTKANGYERFGDDHTGSDAPYVEGAWMTKYNGCYYLQYAVPGTEFNVYNDSVYIGQSPLGPFVRAKNNPFSYKPGGFINGAGHGSTMEDSNGQLWHIASMRISHSHMFERRLGLWKAGIDKDGDMFCDQRYGDWPMRTDTKLWEKPEWMLLSYGKSVTASSGEGMQNVTDEDIRTWWSAAENKAGEWITLDLGDICSVHAVQINFADEIWMEKLPEGVTLEGPEGKLCWLDMASRYTRWILEGSADGKDFFVIEDKSKADTDLPHDLIVRENGLMIRYIRLTVCELPYEQTARISGLRVFGKKDGQLPAETQSITAQRTGDLDMIVSWQEDEAVGHNILWGYAPDKLYHSYMVYAESSKKIGALMKGEPVYVRVDAFNETGITEGTVLAVQ